MERPLLTKTALEVQRAHDVLLSVMFGAQELGISREELQDAMTCASVLCWMLGHGHYRDFEEYLARVERQLAEQGFVLTDDRVLHRGRGTVQ